MQLNREARLKRVGNIVFANQSLRGAVLVIIQASCFEYIIEVTTMNEFQQKLYNALLELTQLKPKAFIVLELPLENEIYQVFNYRLLPNYTTWLTNGSALQCRGITFRMDRNDNIRPVELASFPFEKFFNLGENPLALEENLDLSTVTEILVKEDGSLISSMLLPSGKLFLKSKASFGSPQANAANELIATPEWKELHDWTLDWATRGYTVIMEYTSPSNKIVLPYTKSALTILGLRNHADGSYENLFAMDLPAGIKKLVVKNLVDEVEDTKAFVQSIPKQTEIEGYVVRLQSGQRVKIKTSWYKNLHGLGFNKKLTNLDIAKLVLDQTIDDVRSENANCPETLQRIDKVTQVVSTFYNDAVATTTSLYEAHKKVRKPGFDKKQDKRDFVAKARQEELPRPLFNIAMQLYDDKEVDMAKFVLNHVKKKGIEGLTV